MNQIIRLFIIPVLLVFLMLSSHPAAAVNKGSISSSELKSIIENSEAKVVLLNFWSTWCGPCRKEIPGLVEMRWDYSESDLKILGISLDYNPKTVEVFDKKLGINYPIYIADQDVMEDFEVSAIPKVMVYKQGELVEVHEGYTPNRVLRSLIDDVLNNEPWVEKEAQ